MTSPFSSIDEALSDLKLGKMIILVDDEDRENEGDLVMAAEKVTPTFITSPIVYFCIASYRCQNRSFHADSCMICRTFASSNALQFR